MFLKIMRFILSLGTNLFLILSILALCHIIWRILKNHCFIEERKELAKKESNVKNRGMFRKHSAPYR